MDKDTDNCLMLVCESLLDSVILFSTLYTLFLEGYCLQDLDTDMVLNHKYYNMYTYQKQIDLFRNIDEFILLESHRFPDQCSLTYRYHGILT